jgi:hypothetical protein
MRKPKKGSPPDHYARWTDDDRVLIRQYWSVIPASKLQEAFPGRTRRAVMAQAEKMGLRKSSARLEEMGREAAGARWAKERPKPDPKPPNTAA